MNWKEIIEKVWGKKIANLWEDITKMEVSTNDIEETLSPVNEDPYYKLKDSQIKNLYKENLELREKVQSLKKKIELLEIDEKTNLDDFEKLQNAHEKLKAENESLNNQIGLWEQLDKEQTEEIENLKKKLRKVK